MVERSARFQIVQRVLASVALLAQAPAARSPAVPAMVSEQHGPAAGAEPLRLTLTYGSDLNVLVGGGRRTGADYLGRIGLVGDADLDRLLGWRGASAHISIHQISGRGLSQHRIGNLLAVSGLEAEPALRLFNLWVQQAIGPRADLRIGQFTAGQEFAISDTASLFVNSTFGWPGSFAADQPSGGPAYPLAAPGIRITFAPDARTGLRLALFAGDPAGPGMGDPQRRDRHGLNGLRFAGKPFLIGEAQRSSGGAHPAVTMRAGFWLHFDRFADSTFDIAGRSLASPGAGPALQHRGNAGIYGIVDTALWRGAKGFLRASFSPDDRNTIDLYADCGVAVSGPVSGRSADTIAIGLAVARISPALRRLARDLRALTGATGPHPDFEAVAELSYQVQLGSGISVQPNVQIVIHPGGRQPTALGLGAATPDALIVGLRTSARF
ncbi:MAG: carbohydrate porin [Alphaproteobacteria bacterium]|nr:carbohydrate porin [Alphaproteobacteria bacterium]